MQKLVLCVLPLAVIGAACRTVGPRFVTTTVAPSALGAYVDQPLLLRHDVAKPRIRIADRERPAGACVVAVRVRAASFTSEGARFSLETIGVAKLREHRAGCGRVQPELELVIAGISAADRPASLRARVDEVLQTPEACLAASGVPLERPTGERPLPLLSVDPWYHDRSGRVKHDGEVEMDAVVGSDGRLHQPHVRTSLSEPHQGAVLRAMPLWRFEPARRAEDPVPARVALRPVLHID